MAAQRFTIDFDGYWREEKKSSLPNEPGIYCVYACVFDAIEKTVTLSKLLYVGESGDVNARIANHEKLPQWQRLLSFGEQICYSFGAIYDTHRERCEAAIIFKHKPPANTEYTSAFPFDPTTVLLTGKTARLSPSFTLSRV